MGLRYQKRLNLGKGVGLNVSKSGLSPSVRTKYGSIGTRGFSLRTGIPGLSFRSSSKNALPVMLILAVITGIALVIVNLYYFIGWIFGLLSSKLKAKQQESMVHEDLAKFRDDPRVHFAKFSISTIPEEYRTKPIVIYDLLTENGARVDTNQPIIELLIDNATKATISARVNGKIIFYKLPSQSLRDGEYLCRIDDSPS